MQRYTKEQIEAILAAAGEGLTPKEVETRTGVSWMVCRYHMKKAGLHQDRAPVVDDAMKAEIIRRGQAGEPAQDIAKSMGLNRTLVVHHLKGTGAYVAKGPFRKYTDRQKEAVFCLKENGRSVE